VTDGEPAGGWFLRTEIGGGRRASDVEIFLKFAAFPEDFLHDRRQ
jgi:hypothetical protein